MAQVHGPQFKEALWLYSHSTVETSLNLELKYLNLSIGFIAH